MNAEINYIKTTLDEFRNDIKQLEDTILLHSKSLETRNAVFENFSILCKKYPANPVLLAKFLEYLQLVDDPAILAVFSLEDISRLYEKLTDIYVDDVNINIEYYYFLYNVMDDELKAKEKINSFTIMVDKKLKAISKT